MKQQSLLIEVNASQLKNRLLTIQTALKQENQGIKQFYSRKISQLYDEIAEKDCKIEILQENAQANLRKICELERSVVKKQILIKNLSLRLKTIEAKFRKEISSCMNKISIEVEDYVGKIPHQFSDIQRQVSKKIDISQYFLKAMDKSGPFNPYNEKVQSQNVTQNTTFATLFPERQVSKVKTKGSDYCTATKKNRLNKVKSLQGLHTTNQLNWLLSQRALAQPDSSRLPYAHKRFPSSILSQDLTPTKIRRTPNKRMVQIF